MALKLFTKLTVFQDDGPGDVAAHDADPGSDYIQSLLVPKERVPYREILREHREAKAKALGKSVPPRPKAKGKAKAKQASPSKQQKKNTKHSPKKVAKD